jgi:heme/copper-type cytochrome/quinol oxidase subunit 2
MNPRLRLALPLALWASTASLSPHASAPQRQGSSSRPFAIVASRYRFEPARVEVNEGDLVAIELRSADIAHSLTIEAYRIAKRVGPGQSVSFEFRAERPGTFPFLCDLKAEDGCRKMRGELVVRARP